MKNLLRTIVLLLIFNSSFLITKAQWVSIPDSNFGKWLNTNNYSQCLQGNSTVGWQLDTTCSVVINTSTINCDYAGIQSLTGLQYFSNLSSLICRFNNLNYLPPLPNSLLALDCSVNQLVFLPDLPDQLLSLNCSGNQLTSLPSLPSNISYLECSGNQLNSLTPLPNALIILHCENNLLTSLPNLPNSIGRLWCNYNQLTNLPALPNTLTDFDCSFNQITTLPALPPLLPSLECGHNQLDSLPILPPSLTRLTCTSNRIAVLPQLPPTLNFLVCNDNHLVFLPSLPTILTYLDCSNNQLTSLPELPDLLTDLQCYNNPTLTCLPQLKKVYQLDFEYTGVTCLPNYPLENSFSIPSLDTVPLCNPFNSNGCSLYWNINGKIYNDTSGNCVKEAGEANVEHMKVNLYQNGVLLQQNYSASYGVYSFDTDTGTYTISVDTSGIPFDIICPASGFDTSVITVLDSFDYDKHFAMQCKPGFDLEAHSIEGIVGIHTGEINIGAGDAVSFYGLHCAAGISGTVQLISSVGLDSVTPASGALAPTSFSHDTITWSIADFGAVNFFSDFNVRIETTLHGQLGQQVCFTLIVNPIAGDNNPANNILTHCFTVVGSFDPNEKEVYPAGNIDTAIHWLTYTIHFQNTGTAEAQHIYVTDTLDSNIDAASFQLLAYSHQPMVQLKGNNLRFNFPNINLPDSNTNEALSHGYVQYKVKLKDNLPIGTNINNTAFIYFDFNAPVVTNTTSNTVALATSVANLGIRNADFGLNPNPATESVRISIDESMIGSNLTITDITGRELLHSAVQIRNPQFDIRNLSPGVYFVTLENKTGRLTRKLVKQ